MTPERLQQIKDVDAKRTQGEWFVVGPPWRAKHNGEYVETYVVAGNPDPHGGTPVVDAIGLHEGTDEEFRQHVVQSDADLGFCALASTAIPELVAEVEKLRAEIDRRDLFGGCDGCSTGDCPHDTVQECSDAQAKIIAEQAAEIDRLKDEIAGWKSQAATDDAFIRDTEVETFEDLSEIARLTAEVEHCISFLETGEAVIDGQPEASKHAGSALAGVIAKRLRAALVKEAT